MSELTVKSAEYADGIMGAALDNDDEFSPNAKHIVEAAKHHGWRLEKLLAFLLTIAVDGNMMQPDFNENGAAVVNALRGFAHAVNTGADAIAYAIGYDEDADDFDFFEDAEDGEAELPTPAEVEAITGSPCDEVTVVTRPDDIDPETWDNVMQAYSKLHPRTAFIMKAE